MTWQLDIDIDDHRVFTSLHHDLTPATDRLAVWLSDNDMQASGNFGTYKSQSWDIRLANEIIGTARIRKATGARFG